MNLADFENIFKSDNQTLHMDKYSDINKFLKERFDINIETFQKYLPEIASLFKSYSPNKKLSFFSLDNGIPNLLIDNKTIFYNADDPIAFCR